MRLTLLAAALWSGAALAQPAAHRCAEAAVDVLEIGGSIYKGSYRMRLIYAQLPGECVPMGQEILELATL